MPIIKTFFIVHLDKKIDSLLDCNQLFHRFVLEGNNVYCLKAFPNSNFKNPLVDVENRTDLKLIIWSWTVLNLFHRWQRN